MIFSIPLAWLQLTRQKARFLVALAGIVFVVILLFMQLGFQDALYASATHLHTNLRGDLFLISSQYKALTSHQSFPRSRLYQTLGFDGVEAVSPLYLQFAKVKNPQTGQKYQIFVLGFDPATPVLNLLDVQQNINILKSSNMALFDRASRPEFGPIAKEFSKSSPVNIELFSSNEIVGHRVEVGGLFTLGPSFGVDGNLIINYLTLLQIFNDRRAGNIDIGLITLKHGASIQKVISNLKFNLPKDILVLTRQEFVAFEKDYWATRTPIGFVFNMSVSMGFIIGTAIVYQILYNNISNQLVEYATLKAIGFKNNYFLSIVFQQALILSFLAYIPGFLISTILYDLASKLTYLPIVMSANKVALVLISTVIMCLFSGSIAISKLRAADPSDIF